MFDLFRLRWQIGPGRKTLHTVHRDVGRVTNYRVGIHSVPSCGGEQECERRAARAKRSRWRDYRSQKFTAKGV